MIKVNYTELDGPAGPTCRLEASGHAGYAPAGQDIVCAGASTLMQTLCALLAALLTWWLAGDKQAAAGTSATVFKSRMAKLVILFSLLRVAQYCICFRCFLKFLFCFFIPRVHIRMIFFGKDTICFFYCCVICVFINA